MAERQEGTAVTWWQVGRIVLKAALLFVVFNLLFAWARPLERMGGWSLYNELLPGRARLPYGENPAADYNLTLNNIPAMMASHEVARPKAADEFRVLVLGDSGVWGWLLRPEETLAAQITRLGLETGDGRRVVAYNLGFPVLAVAKDLLLLDAAMAYDPDLIIWPVTLDSLPREKQLTHPLLQNNPQRVRRLIDTYGLALDRDDPRFVARDFWQETITGRRRDLADLLRLQLVGVAWAATGIDQDIPADFPLRQSDFEADLSWQGYEEPAELDSEGLALEVFTAGVARAGDVPVLIVNEPIFISSGENSDLRYNSFYPRWAYDQYRNLLARVAAEEEWLYLDVWDAIPPAEFTDTPVHMTAAGTAQFAALLQDAIGDVAGR